MKKVILTSAMVLALTGCYKSYAMDSREISHPNGCLALDIHSMEGRYYLQDERHFGRMVLPRAIYVPNMGLAKLEPMETRLILSDILKKTFVGYKFESGNDKQVPYLYMDYNLFIRKNLYESKEEYEEALANSNNSQRALKAFSISENNKEDIGSLPYDNIFDKFRIYSLGIVLIGVFLCHYR